MDSALFLVLGLISISISISTISTYATNIKYPIQSLYQFGDSLSDTGNLVRLLPVGPTLPPNRLPYGETFPGRPTGRWCDGKLIIDFIAMGLGVPLLNPYLDKNASFKNGVNFAVAGATALNASFFASRGVIVPPYVGSLYLQLTSFRTYLDSIFSPQESAENLRRSLIFLGEFGGNDIYYSLSQGKSLDEIRSYVPLITQAITNATRAIIRGGAASRVVVPGISPLGCFPATLASFGSNDSAAYDEFGCLKNINILSAYQNRNLQTALDALRREFPGVAIIYADYYNALRSIIRLAPIFGFDRANLMKACCESRQFNPFSSPGFCGDPSVPVCPDPKRYIHWDGLHLTQRAHRLISQIIIPDIIAGIN